MGNDNGNGVIAYLSKRETGHSLAKLTELLSSEPISCEHFIMSGCCGGHSAMPEGLIRNEIGAIFIGGGEESEQAKEELLKMLKDNRSEVKSLAYFFLTGGLNQLDPKGLEALKDFVGMPQNVELVMKAEERLAQICRSLQ
jgi:hypothetical protein